MPPLSHLESNVELSYRVCSTFSIKPAPKTTKMKTALFTYRDDLFEYLFFLLFFLFCIFIIPVLIVIDVVTAFQQTIKMYPGAPTDSYCFYWQYFHTAQCRLKLDIKTAQDVWKSRNVTDVCVCESYEGSEEGRGSRGADPTEELSSNSEFPLVWLTVHSA